MHINKTCISHYCEPVPSWHWGLQAPSHQRSDLLSGPACHSHPWSSQRAWKQSSTAALNFLADLFFCSCLLNTHPWLGQSIYFLSSCLFSVEILLGPKFLFLGCLSVLLIICIVPISNNPISRSFQNLESAKVHINLKLMQRKSTKNQGPKISLWQQAIISHMRL